MNISKQEAKESLTEIETIIAQTRREIATGTASSTLMLWGIIWVLGFAANQFLPKVANWIWLALIFLGFTCTWIFTKKSSFQRHNDYRGILVWLILVAYIMFWSFMLKLNMHESILFSSTVCMCVYVICGLWFGRFWIYLGLTVTVLSAAGYYLFPRWFPLWMAITGGGSLILSGMFIRKFWK